MRILKQIRILGQIAYLAEHYCFANAAQHAYACCIIGKLQKAPILRRIGALHKNKIRAITLHRAPPIRQEGRCFCLDSRISGLLGPKQEEQMAAALQYLQGNSLMDYSELEQNATEATDNFHALSYNIKSTEAAMAVNLALRGSTRDATARCAN